MTSDSYAAHDVQNDTAWTEVKFVSDKSELFESQTLVNRAGFSVDVSFDGVTQHGLLTASGASSVLSWDFHPKASVYLRRTTGSGGGAAYVDVYANRQGALR